MGRAAQRRQSDWERTVAAVRKRAGGVCECCRGTSSAPLDPHHCFGRSNQVPRKYADLAEVVAGLCRTCHDRVTDHPRCVDAHRLRDRAAQRFVRAYGQMPYVLYGPEYTPLQIVRDVIRTLEQQEKAA